MGIPILARLKSDMAVYGVTLSALEWDAGHFSRQRDPASGLDAFCAEACRKHDKIAVIPAPTFEKTMSYWHGTGFALSPVTLPACNNPSQGECHDHPDACRIESHQPFH